MADLKLVNVVKRFGQNEVIHRLNLAVEDGEFVVLVGPSGCGKSTLLRIIAGLEAVTEGEVWIGDRRANEIDPANRGVAMVFQNFALYPHMSVEENMGFGLKMARRPKHEIKERVARAAEILHLTPYLKRRPKELSGGQRQRVAIGRAIVREPEIFLFDEPLSNLDAELRVQMRIELSKLHSELQTTMIYVTHDQMEAMTLADKIVVLNSGTIEQTGSSIELYQRPANLFVAGFFGSPKMNFLSVKAVSVQERSVTIRSNDLTSELEVPTQELPQIAARTELTLGIRPEHLMVTAPQKGKGLLTIEVVESLGDLTYIHGTTPSGTRVTISVKGFQDLKHADSVGYDLKVKDAHLFDPEGHAI
ncbi:MAG: sn-glycerol-3-phosphate ABC transporter ATP-binding protein UgpC [Verrucomicrobia bacterium]|nr:sn-glycerol-3-phosphate ABC transporter ATP-binding protein UgpC [Verrucomicrobiota bacterium]